MPSEDTGLRRSLRSPLIPITPGPLCLLVNAPHAASTSRAAAARKWTDVDIGRAVVVGTLCHQCHVSASRTMMGESVSMSHLMGKDLDGPDYSIAVTRICSGLPVGVWHVYLTPLNVASISGGRTCPADAIRGHPVGGRQ